MLFQYDLTKSDVEVARALVGEYDGHVAPNLPTTFFQMMLAPNGKIYMTGTSSVNVLHVIHNPDALGLACDFRQHDLVLPARIMWQVPNFPHFRLFDLPGSPCDTLGINGSVAVEEPERSKEMQVALWPNPAQESCIVELRGEEGLTGRWELLNNAGQVALHGAWSESQTTQQINLKSLPPGAYYFILYSDKGHTAEAKLMVLR